MLIRRHGFLLFSALLMTVLFTTHAMLVWRTEAEKLRPYGRFTVQHILDRTEPLCQALVPDAERLYLTAERRVTYAKGVSSRRHWNVHCSDARGNDVAQFEWDAESGLLVHAGHPAPVTVNTSGKPLDREAVLRESWRWLQALGIAEARGAWRLADEPKYLGYAWAVEWRGEGRAASVTIDGRDGTFTQVRSWPNPSSRIPHPYLYRSFPRYGP